MARKTVALGLALLLAGCSTMAAEERMAGAGSTLSERVKQLSRGTAWREVSTVPAKFDTHDPQGMVKIGDYYDGRYIWVAVAEYRPNSRSIIYRVDPATMQATEVFRYGDHIGGIVHNRDDRTLHGMSWGSRRFYRWTLDGQGRVSNADVAPEKLRGLTQAHYIDYQDCEYLGRGEMLCSGLTNYQTKADAPRFALGGLEIVDLSTNRVKHQVPIQLWTASGLPMTQNPVGIEPTAGGLRAYFMPEDGKSMLYIYEADVR